MKEERINVDYMTTTTPKYIETTVPLHKKDITFEKVDGEKVFDLCMEIDKLQQENTELKQKLSSIEELINNNSELIYVPEEDSDISYIASERVLEILRGNNNVKN